jgi:nucleoside-diphosphate-sugar epimerase
MEAKHHILLLGGTGICGLVFARAALNAGHKLTLYVRTPSKIPADLSSNENLSVIQGELEDVEGLTKTAACGADVFISLAGPTLGKREGTVCLTSFMDQIIGLILTIAHHQRPSNPLPAPPCQRHHKPNPDPLHRIILRARR